MRVASNKFNNNGYPYCLSLWNSNRSRCLVFNNLFTGKVTSEGIRAWPSHYQIDFWHNTFALETDGWVVNNRQCCTVAWNTYYNNIFAVTGNGGAIYNNGGGQLECDNNLYFVASGKIGRNGTTDYTTLASWSAAIQGVANNGAYDSNSISANPLFMGATDFHLTPASPALGAAKATPGSFSVGFEVVDDYDGFMRGTTKDIGCFEVTGWKRFGAGCPGTANLVPAFNIGGNVAPGSTASLELSNARASASCVLTLGVSATSIPVGGTCQLLTSPLILVFFQSDAQGNAALPTPIPANVAILGLSGYLQFGVTDPMGAALGIMALSDGAQVRL
jgi:hypothetical protein